MRQLIHGLKRSAQFVGLCGFNAYASSEIGKLVDWNGKKETPLQKNKGDVYALGSAAYITKTILLTKGPNPLFLAGASIPAAIAGGIAARMCYEKSGSTIKEAIAEIKKMV